MKSVQVVLWLSTRSMYLIRQCLPGRLAIGLRNPPKFPERHACEHYISDGFPLNMCLISDYVHIYLSCSKSNLRDSGDFLSFFQCRNLRPNLGKNLIVAVPTIDNCQLRKRNSKYIARRVPCPAIKRHLLFCTYL